MPVVFAYLAAIVVVPLFLLADWLTAGYFVQLLYSPVPLGRLSWVPATVLYITVIYVLFWIVGTLLVRSIQRYEDAGQASGWAEDIVALDHAVRRDYGNWPLALMLLTAGLTFVSLPALHFHLISPIAWTLVALIAPTLGQVFSQRELTPRLPEPTPAATYPQVSPITSVPPGEMIDTLRRSASYRGQLRAVAVQSPKPAHPASDPSRQPWAQVLQPGTVLGTVLQSLGFGTVATLPAHQIDALSRLLPDPGENAQREHVTFATGPGSGRRLVAFLVALERTLLRGGHVLIVSPSDARSEEERKRFDALAQESGWRYALYDLVVSATDQAMPIPDPPPEILFCSVESLSRVLLRQSEDWEQFFDGLELVVAHDIERYCGIHGANVAQVFRRLHLVAESHQQRLQFIATSYPAENLRSFTMELFGLAAERDHVALVEVDTSARPEQHFGIWLPALDRRPSHLAGRQLTRQVMRQTRYETTVELTIALASIEDCRILMYCHDIHAVDLRSLQDEVFLRLGRPLAPSHFFVTMDETELAGKQQHYDVLVIIGTPSNRLLIDRLTGPLGAHRGGGLCLVIGDHSPAGLSAIHTFHETGNTTQRFSLFPQQILSSRHPDIIAKHLACAIHEAELTPAKVTRVFGYGCLAILDQWIRQERVLVGKTDEDTSRPETGNQIITPLFRADEAYSECHLDTVSGTCVVPVHTSLGHVVHHVDRHRVAAELYPGRTIQLGNQALVIAPNDGGHLFRATTNAKSIGIESVPIYQTTISLDTDQSAEVPSPIRISGGLPVRLFRRNLRIALSLHGIREGGNELDDAGVIAREIDDVIKSEFSTSAVVLTAPHTSSDFRLTPQIARTLACLLRSALASLVPPAFSDHEYRVVAIPEITGFLDDWCVVLFQTVEHGLGFDELVENNATRLFAEAYRILVRCPCQAGCKACSLADWDITDPPHESTQGPLIDKRATLLFLGALLGEEARNIAERNPVELDIIRYEAVTDVNDLIFIRDRVLEFGLYPVLNVDAGQYRPASIRFMDKHEQRYAHLLGLFRTWSIGDRKQREIAVRPATEEELVAVIAHEAAHDWSFQLASDGQRNLHPALTNPKHVPYDGRLFAEGFAQWMELRVLDAYGFKEDVDDVTFRFFDEYGEGFHVVKRLEDEKGVHGMLTQLHHEMSAEEVDRLLEETGADSRIRDVMRRIRDAEVELPPTDIKLEVLEPEADPADDDERSEQGQRPIAIVQPTTDKSEDLETPVSARIDEQLPAAAESDRQPPTELSTGEPEPASTKSEISSRAPTDRCSDDALSS